MSGGGKGGVFDVRDGSLALSGVTITGGRADRGGALRNDHGRLWLTRVLVRGNSARASAAGPYKSGMATLTYVIVGGNRARAGGSLANFGELMLNGSSSTATSPRSSATYSTAALRD
jgi:hypothetical protein